MKKIVVFLLVLFSFAAQAQEKIAVTAADYSNNEVEMADVMRSEGKIYVLVNHCVDFHRLVNLCDSNRSSGFQVGKSRTN